MKNSLLPSLGLMVTLDGCASAAAPAPASQVPTKTFALDAISEAQRGAVDGCLTENRKQTLALTGLDAYRPISNDGAWEMADKVQTTKMHFDACLSGAVGEPLFNCQDYTWLAEGQGENAGKIVCYPEK